MLSAIKASALLLAANAKLKVLSPTSLASQYKEGVIEASYANFGFIPYG
jgi:hypothetical protein